MKSSEKVLIASILPVSVIALLGMSPLLDNVDSSKNNNSSVNAEQVQLKVKSEPKQEPKVLSSDENGLVNMKDVTYAEISLYGGKTADVDAKNTSINKLVMKSGKKKGNTVIEFLGGDTSYGYAEQNGSFRNILYPITFYNKDGEITGYMKEKKGSKLYSYSKLYLYNQNNEELGYAQVIIPTLNSARVFDTNGKKVYDLVGFNHNFVTGSIERNKKSKADIPMEMALVYGVLIKNIENNEYNQKQVQYNNEAMFRGETYIWGSKQ